MQRLAVLGFSGEHGDVVANALTNNLSGNEFYTLADRTQLRPIRRVSTADGNPGLLSLEDMNLAHEAGVDGLIVGEVIASHCEDHPVPANNHLWRLVSLFDNGPSGRADDDPLPADRRRRRRDATVTVAFRLIDAQTGKIRLSRQITHSCAEVLHDAREDGPTRSETLNELARLCVDDFMDILVPHRVTERVTLAAPIPFRAGCALVHEGNEFATRGRWDEAIRAWEQALTTNPNSDTALYNLSIAHANRQEFARAETYAIRAMNVRRKEAYQTGLERIREQSAAFDQTLQQRRDLSHALSAATDVKNQ